MKRHHVWAEIIELETMTLNLRFAVKITSPVEMSMRFYDVSIQEAMTISTSAKHMKHVALRILQEKVLTDYNRLIEDSPILDMFNDPSKYQTASWIEFTFPSQVSGI